MPSVGPPSLPQIPETCHNELEIAVWGIWSELEMFWFRRNTRLCVVKLLPISVQDEVVCPICYIFCCLEEVAIANICLRFDVILFSPQGLEKN